MKDEQTRAAQKRKQEQLNFWQPLIVTGCSILALVISIFALMSKDLKIFAFFSDEENLQTLIKMLPILINIGNFLVSIIALIWLTRINPSNYEIKNNHKFKSLAELNEINDENLNLLVKNTNKRVKGLVGQFKGQVIGFAGSLVFVYSVILISSFLSSFNDREINFFTETTNIFNLSNALFILLAFNVLNYKTLSERKDMGHINAMPISYYESNRYWIVPVILYGFYCLIFVSFSMSCITGQCNQKYLLNGFDLTAGLFNGLTMMLLFGKYVSMEFSLRETKLYNKVFEHIFYPFSETFEYKKIVSFGIVFILPIYALAQPLFGSLTIEMFGKTAYLQTGVYAACLIGKICFLHLTYILISKNLLHLYLFGLVSKVGNFKQLEDCMSMTVKPKDVGTNDVV
jgi:hypothetical protein